ncbi:MAG: putative tail fiber protein [Prokaryotic dsDNA virus sp.]|nr:MAG: putative tail fiber protein [Prokaryotic dsDNA virus sp.]|tara:strand:- start:40414 stop:44232 length:3819 start_codon:yes stop_codon:yes gene_type:complete
MSIQFKQKIDAEGGIEGLTLTHGISGSNFNISGVNALYINDPGEGVVFQGTNNVHLFAIDDTTDKKMNFSGASELQVDGNKVALESQLSSYLPLTGGTLTGELTIPNKIIHSGDTDTYMQFEAADVWRVVTGGTERLDINTNRILVGDDMNMQYDGISTGNSGTVVYGGFLNPASEANMVHIPHIINDLAGFNKWSNATITTSGFYKTRSGSSGSYTYSNEVSSTDGGWANAFDSHSSTAGSWYSDNGSDGVYTHGTDTPGVVELEWTNEATYSLWAGIVFGSNSFTATYVKIEAYRGGAWQTLCEITNNTDQVILRQVGSNSGTGAATTRLKYTLGGSVNGNYFRIHSLYMANYRAGDNNLNNTGTDTTRGVNFLERYKDGYLHGHLRPGKDDTYDLGSSSYQWRNGYFDGNVICDGVNVEGNITVSGTVDGVDIAALASANTGDQDLSSYITQTDADARYVLETGGSSSAMTGDLHIIAGSPKIVLKDSTDDDDQQIVFRNNGNGDDYKITTQDFTGAGTGDGLFIGSESSDPVKLVTNDTIALTIDTSQNATFAESVTVTGDLDVQGSGITLVDSIVFSGNGRIQGIDTVSASTDAASKGYVDGKFTTVGSNFAQLGDVSVASYIRVNADESLSYLNAAQFLSAIGGSSGDNLGNHTATQDLDIGSNALINDGATVFYNRTSPEIDYYDYSKLVLESDSVELHSPGEFIFSGEDPFIYLKKPSAGAFLNGNQNVMKIGLISSFGPGLEAVDTTFANLNTDLHFIVQKAGSQYEALKISGDGDVGTESQVYIKDNLSVTKRVGIGTTSPTADLHIQDAGNNSSGIRIEAIGSAKTDTVNMHFQGSSGNAPFYISRAATGGAEIQIQADGDLILNGTNGDNVGIGTTTPQQKLHVSNNILCGGNLYFNTGTSNYIKGTGGGLEWYTNSNKIVDITYGGDVEVTNNLDLDNAKLLTWGALGGTTPTTYITGADNLTNGGSRISLVGNFNYAFSNSTEGHIVFKNSNNNGTTSGTVGLVADIVTDSTATGNISTNIRFGRASNMQYGYNRYTGSIEYISTNQTSGEKMIFKCAQYAFLQANGSPSSGIDSIKIGGNTNNQIGYIDLWGDSGGSKPFFNIQDTRYQPATSLSNPVVRIQNNFHSTNSRYQIVFQRFSSTSSIRGSIATNNSGTTYNTTSDYRLKTDAKDFNALDLVKQIPVYDFKWKNIDNRDYGCFAHELAEVVPNAVNGEKDAIAEDETPDYQQADYSKLVPVLLKAIKELEAKVAALESNQ